MLDFKTASTIATSIVHSKLDYCNSLFLNLDSTQIQYLQLIQNSLTRTVTKMTSHHHITPVLKSLHWLKIPEHIHFKVLSLIHNSLQYSQPAYLHQTFHHSPSPLYPIIFLYHPVTSHHMFSKTLWNDLPPELCTFSLPPPSSLQITNHNLHPAPLSVIPWLSTRN